MVWVLTLGGARHSFEELLHAWKKIQKKFHIFVCPRFIITECLRSLYFSDDMIFKIKAGSCSFWPDDMHGTLIVELLFPYIYRNTW